ncbi:MAG: hypothetical protein QGH45_03370 [Myxococcota bacterium]|jgi:hypothetical protein|nr:hypothetical protein [Myxococcota bacterium]
MIGAIWTGLRDREFALLLAAGSVLAFAGCEQVDEYDGGLFAPFPEGVVSQSGDAGSVDVVPSAETEGAGDEPTAAADTAAEPLIRDTGGPPAVTSGAPAEGGSAESGDVGEPLAASAAVDSTPPTATDQPAETAVTGTPTLAPIVGGTPATAPTTADPAAPAAAPTPTATAPIAAAPASTPAVALAPPATAPTAPAVGPTSPAPNTAPVAVWSGAAPPAASCGLNALAVSAPLAQIELVSVFPTVSPASAIVRFPAGTEAMVTVGDILGEEGGKVVVVGPDHIGVTVLSVGSADTLTMATHTLTLGR